MKKNSFGQGLTVFLVVIGIFYIIGAISEASEPKWYTNENIDQMLMERHLNKKARRSSHKNHMKGPRKRTEEDDVRFAQSFEKLIQMAKAKEGAQSGII